MMKSLIIFTHPWDGSFNYNVLENVILSLQQKGNEVDVIDLNKDGYNPVMMSDDLRLFGRGEYNDPLAKAYVERLKTADEIIFIYPIWWYGEPAILSGFFDKVLLKNHVYEQVDGHTLSPLLDIRKTTVITTASIDKEAFKTYGDPVNTRLINGIFKTIGIKNAVWLHCANVYEPQQREVFINEIKGHFA